MSQEEGGEVSQEEGVEVNQEVGGDMIRDVGDVVSGNDELLEDGLEITEAETQEPGEHHAKEDDVGDMLELQGREQPDVPEPVQADAANLDGWKAIDRLGGWVSFLVEFRMLEEIPEQHKGAWPNAWMEILSRIRDAENDAEKDRALLWLSFLPQALQRKPTRGGRAGR